VLSALLSFFLPGAIVVFLYVKIFRKLRSHQLYMFAQSKPATKAGKVGQVRRSLPQVIIEEVSTQIFYAPVLRNPELEIALVPIF
jgi:hypothetical protein